MAYAPLRLPAKLPANLWQEILCATGVAIVALKVVWDTRLAHDLSPWDETLYLARGVRLFVPGFPNDLRGLPPADWGPIYSLYYAFLHLFVRDLVSLFFAAWSLVVVLTSAAFYALVRALRGAPPIALVATALLANSRFFEVTPYPGQFATLLLLSGAVLVVHARAERTKFRWALLALLLATFVRPELLVALLLVAGAALWRAIQRLRTHRLSPRFAVDALVVGSLAAALFGVFGNPISRERSFFAFGQHYAVYIVQRDRLDVDPWPNWEKYFSRDFGNAKSVMGALHTNPAAFLRHVEFNLSLVPVHFAEIIELKLMLGDAVARTLQPIVRDGFAILVVCGFGFALPGLWRDQRQRAVLLLFLALAAATAISVLLVHPRWHYLLPVGAFMEAFAAIGFSRVVTWLMQYLLPRLRRAGMAAPDRWRALSAVAAFVGVLSLVPNPAHGWCLQSLVLGPLPRPPTDLLKTVETLRALRLHDHVVVLEKEWGCALYAGLDFDRVDEWTKHEPFNAYIAERHVGVIVVTSWLTKDDGFGEDPEYRAFLADPVARGFRVVTVPTTDRFIAVRDDVH
jgi:hypothetical protein